MSYPTNELAKSLGVTGRRQLKRFYRTAAQKPRCHNHEAAIREFERKGDLAARGRNLSFGRIAARRGGAVSLMDLLK